MQKTIIKFKMGKKINKFKGDKRVVTAVWCFGVVFVLIALGYASTVISDTGIVSPLIDSENITTDNINNIQYVDPNLEFKAGVDEAQARCIVNETCKIVFPVKEYLLDENVGVEPNTVYEGFGTTIIVDSDIRVFTSSDDGILKENIKITGFTFIDSNISAVRGQSFITLINSDFKNVEISHNSFFNRSGTSIIVGHSTSPIRSVENFDIHHNNFEGIRSALNYYGDYLNFNDNYLDATGSAGTVAEKEGIDWNTVSNHPDGVGVGSVSRNIVINFTEQGLDINAPQVVISENHIILMADGGTTTGINSYNNRYGIVANNIIEMSSESTDNGMKIYNSYDLAYDDAGQVITGNKIIGKGTGTGFRLLQNNNIFNGNSIQDVATAVEITGNNTQMGVNHFIDNTLDIDDNGLNNEFSVYTSINMLDLSYKGLSIEQESSLNGTALYSTFDFPALSLLRKSSSRGSSLVMGNNNAKFLLYADNNNLEIQNDASVLKFKFSQDGNLTIVDLSGTGNDFACLDSTGKLFRSATACA